MLIYTLRTSKFSPFHHVRFLLNLKKIVDMEVIQRMFMITDRDLPYELFIKYKNPRIEYNLDPIIGGEGVVLNNLVNPFEYIYARYPTKEEAENEMKAILHQQSLYTVYVNK